MSSREAEQPEKPVAAPLQQPEKPLQQPGAAPPQQPRKGLLLQKRAQRQPQRQIAPEAAVGAAEEKQQKGPQTAQTEQGVQQRRSPAPQTAGSPEALQQSLDVGELTLEGNIQSLCYSRETKRRGSFWSRVF